MAFLAILAALVFSTSTSPAAQTPVQTYCSRTGDLCYGVLRKDGAIFFDIRTAAKYFPRYHVCVKPPNVRATCRSFPLRRRDKSYGSSVRWYRNFPNRGPGRYVVTWRLQQPLGPPRSFVLR